MKTFRICLTLLFVFFTKNVFAEQAIECSKDWNVLPSKLLKEKNILSKDVESYSNESIKFVGPCKLTPDKNKGLFAVIPGVAPYEITGDTSIPGGKICSADDPGEQLDFVALKGKGPSSKDSSKHGFIFYGGRTEISKLKLEYFTFQDEKNLRCANLGDPKTKYDITRLKIPNTKYDFFFAKSARSDCQEDLWGKVIASKCSKIEDAHRLGDCPEGGPRSGKLGGEPIGVYILKSDEKTESFLMLDSTFWEYYGHSLVKLDESANPTTEIQSNVFTDNCMSH